MPPEMIRKPSPPASTRSADGPAPGSVGVVETEYLDLPEPLMLDSGRRLPEVRIAYETYGRISPARDNVILVCHALSGDAHAAGLSEEPGPSSTRDGFGAEDRDGSVGTEGKALGWWDGMIGPERPSTPIATTWSPPTCSAAAAGAPGRAQSRPTPVVRTAETSR